MIVPLRSDASADAAALCTQKPLKCFNYRVLEEKDNNNLVTFDDRVLIFYENSALIWKNSFEIKFSSTFKIGIGRDLVKVEPL